MEPKFVGDLRGVHSIWQVLLVGENEEKGVTKLIFIEHPLEFLPGLRNTFPIIRIHHEDDTLCVLEIYRDI